MSFGNPIVGSGDQLIRNAIRSQNYVTGLTGWIIRKDGSAEFNGDVIINNGELFIQDPDGSYVRIFDENPGNGAVILIRPANISGATVDPAQIISGSSSGPATAFLQIIGPNVNSTGFAFIDLSSDSTGLELITLAADRLRFTTAMQLLGPGDIAYRTIGFNLSNISMITPPAPAGLTSATPIDITGASTTTYQKAYNGTRTELFMSAGGYITAGAGASVTFGVLISGGIGDFSIVKGSFSSLSNRLQFSGSRLLSSFASGTYTITPRWFRSAGTSTVNMDATDASLTVSVREVIGA